MFLAKVFTIMYVGRVFCETTMYFMEILWEYDNFFEILGPFEPFLAISRYPDYEMFFPCIILSSMIFSHQLSCFNIHNIQRIALLAQNFHQMGAILGTKISLIMFLAMVFTGMYVGRVF